MSQMRPFSRPVTGRPFIKMHGLRNHFVIVDARSDPFSASIDEVIRICDPETGVGGDQLIVIESSASADAFMRIINVDGREAEACGNATRCVAWLLLEEAGANQVVLETRAGKIECKRTGDEQVSCEMGAVSMDWQAIPLSREIDTLHVDCAAGPLDDGIALNIGNPHIVFFVDDIDAVDLEALAPGIQQDALFPEQVNVGIARLLAPDHLQSKVYERGAGLTTACGSGACVAACAALARGLTDERSIRVSMRAGEVIIDISEEGVATMTGPVAYCFSGFI
jgi:diaminopimelate epimerase